jgi:hypothetical protein
MCMWPGMSRYLSSIKWRSCRSGTGIRDSKVPKCTVANVSTKPLICTARISDRASMSHIRMFRAYSTRYVESRSSPAIRKLRCNNIVSVVQLMHERLWEMHLHSWVTRDWGGDWRLLAGLRHTLGSYFQFLPE